MKNAFLKLTVFALGLFVLQSCGDDTGNEGNLSVNLTGLENLGSDYAYEGWLIVDGAAKSAGIFTVDDNGEMSENSFLLDQDDIDDATAYVLTIEPSPDSDPSPSSVHILAGDFSGASSNLSVGHSSAIGDDFSASTGTYILATPTDGNSDVDENSGVWWLDISSGMPVAGLDLPILPNGWEYEGWAVIEGQPVSTGRFTSVSENDDDNSFSDTAGGPPFPGEDFLNSAPSGLTFPTDLAGATVVISVEPSPDNSPAPFLLKPLVGAVPATAVDHTSYTMSNNADGSNPSGSVSR